MLLSLLTTLGYYYYGHCSRVVVVAVEVVAARPANSQPQTGVSEQWWYKLIGVRFHSQRNYSPNDHDADIISLIATILYAEVISPLYISLLPHYF